MDSFQGMSSYDINRFLLWVARATEEYFKDPEVQARFEAWKLERENKQKLIDTEGGDCIERLSEVS